MNKKSKLTFLIISLVIQFPLIGLLFAMIISNKATDVTILIPVRNSIFDIIALFVISPIVMILIMQFFSVILANGLFMRNSSSLL